MVSTIRARADLDRYLAAFNNNDYDTYAAYYAPDIEMSIGAIVLKGREEVMGFFKEGRKQILEHVEPVNVIIDTTGVAMTSIITFTAVVDFHEPFFDIGPPVLRGGGYQAPFVVFYGLDDKGQMKSVAAGKTQPAKVRKPREIIRGNI